MNRVFRSRLALVALLIAVFVSGGLAGAAGDRLLHADEALERRHRGYGKHHGMERLLDELELSQEQRAEIERVLDRHRPRVEAIWDSCKPRMSAHIDSTNAEIRALLTPEQRDTFDGQLREREARRRDRRESPERSR